MSLRRSDRRALLFFFAVILAFWGGIVVERRLAQRSNQSLALDEAAMDSLSSSASALSSPANRYASSVEVGPSSNDEGTVARASGAGVDVPETFAFDPNTADAATFRRLGLADWQIENIYRYRARGGRYHVPEDFKRLYGMTPEVYERLAPYIHIDKRFRYYDEEDFTVDEARRHTRRVERQAHYDSLRRHGEAARKDSLERLYPRREKFTERVVLDLNTVDSATLMKVPGIALVRARQILRHRDLLGGFVRADQLLEIGGFPEDLLVWFTVKDGRVRRLNVNTASYAELAHHPYIGSDRARAIVTHRSQRGPLTSLDELSLQPGFSVSNISRIEPYIEY